MSNALLEAYRRLSVEGIIWRVMWQMLDKFTYASETAVTDHQRLVEAYEREDIELAKSVIIGHTERAKRVYQRAVELSGARSEQEEEAAREKFAGMEGRHFLEKE